MANTRDDFTKPIKQQLASRVGYRCSNPDCRKLTIGPSSDVKKSVSIGVAAHITAAAKGGKRYDASLSQDERKDFNNGIWLCQNCAKLIDSDENKYTVELIKSWKSAAEQQASEELQSISSMQIRNAPKFPELYNTPEEVNISKYEWSPSCELFSCQTNLMYSEYFTGRIQECSALMTLVNESSKVLISGMGGIGKTELARWIYQQSLQNDTFRHVGFLSYRDSIDETLLSALNPPDELPRRDQKEWAWNALHKLVQTERTLLVVDDVNKTVRQDTSLHRLLNLSCTVVLTSRRRSMANCKCLQIPSLKLDEGAKLFENIYGPIRENEKGNLTTIVQKIAYCHPLTIKILASIGKSKKIGLADLRFELETMKFKLAYVEDGEPIKFAEEYRKLFNLANLSIPEIKTLEYFSILPYVQLPKKHCAIMMQEAAEDTHDIVLSMLAQKNWLEESTGSFSMHPLIAEAIRFFRPFPAQEHPAFLNGTIKVVACLENHILLQKVLPYTDVILAVANYYLDINPVDSIYMCVALSLKYYNAARYKLACDLLEVTLALAEKTHAWELYDIVLYHLSLAYIKAGNYAEAYKNTLLLVNYRELYCEEGAIEVGEAYHAFGEAQRCLSYFEEALMSYYTALKYYESAEEENKGIGLSNLYGDIGGVYLDLGQFEDALTFLQKDVDMKEQDGMQDVELAVAYNNIADLYMQTEQYDLAEKNFLKAIELITLEWGKQSHYLGSIYSNLGNLYHLLGQDEKALYCICRSIDIQIAEFEKHPLLAASYNSKAVILQSLGRVEEALQENDKAHEMLLNTIGEENTIMAMVELMYASAYSNLQNYAEVIPHAKKVCKILIRFYAHDDIHLINARIFLGEALSYTDDYQGALEVLKQVERNTEGTLLLEQSFRAAWNLVRIYIELAQYEDALQQCLKTLKICKQIGKTQEVYLLILEKLILCYRLSGRKEELEQWLQETFKE